MKRANFLCVKIVTGLPKLYTIERFVRAANELGIKAEIVNPFHSALDLTPDQRNDSKNTLVLPRVSGTSLDDIDLLYCQIQKSMGAKIVNDPDLSLRIRDKASQSFHLANLGIPCFKTWALRGELAESKFLDIKSPLIFNNEWVLKTFRGNKGKGVSLIKGHDSLASVWETLRALGDQRFIIQPRYKIESEWRILVLPKSADQKPRIAGGLLKKLKTGNEDFRLNAERIEASYFEELPPKIQSFAEDIIQKVPFDLMGIDLALCGEDLMVCEINPVPGFEFFDQVSKKDMGLEIISRLLNS